jgi:hypothetical protein
MSRSVPPCSSPSREPIERGIGGRHGVVDKERERDDECAQRNALHVDAGDLHDGEHDGERQRYGESR